MKVRFRLRAAQQLEELVEFYDSLSLTVRRKLQNAVAEAIDDIQQSPLTCFSVTERTRMKIIRRFKIGIFFEMEDTFIRITQVVDLRSDWQSGFENLN